jgi:lipoyl(octanoyl) transferase
MRVSPESRKRLPRLYHCVIRARSHKIAGHGVESSKSRRGNVRSHHQAAPILISVLQLERIDYATGLALQAKLVDLRKNGRIGDVLLLLEHPPVITLGRNAKTANVIAPAEMLAERGVEAFPCDRGGDVTFHGPGQLVGYPIFDLRGFPSEGGHLKTLGAVGYVRKLEEALIRTCADFRIPTGRVAGLTGAWTEPGGESQGGGRVQAKIAAIGVHISRGVTSHGFALNVNTDLSYFDLIVPCGISDMPVTSMQKELGHSVAMDQVAHAVARNFGQVFGSQILWLESLDALLEPKVGIPARPPAELRELHGQDETRWA